MKQQTIKLKATLFDLDGVVFDTEPQYSQFWGEQCRLYYPDKPGLEYSIKGQTLDKVYNLLFTGELEKEREAVTARLNKFEEEMNFDFVRGFEPFLNEIRRSGIKTAVVTSSNKKKMQAVYNQRPDFASLFDAILTSEDFDYSKPHPDCYLKAAARFNAAPDECLVFEDSFNGIKSGRAAGMRVIGLSTTNTAEQIQHLCDLVIPDYTSITISQLQQLAANKN